MKYAIVERRDDISRNTAEKFHRIARDLGLIHDQQTPDVVVSIGGDGTMLHAFHSYLEQLDHVAFIGVHTGHLGFFADWKPGEVEILARLMAASGPHDPLRIVRYPIAEIRIETDSGTTTQLALNEFTVKGDSGMLVAQLNINDEPFEMFRGDGICISSPCGSTAYNKSLGGAIIHPSLETIQIAEIASINNRVYRTLGSSLLLPKHHHCDIYPKEGQKLLLNADHLTLPAAGVRSIRCMVSEKKISFARLRSFPFWTRVKDAFIDL
ncbi:NAD kinase [Paenibacillus thermoaerophilus]|uniref:NAD kinase n=1 Tax=Paenibacillus thermoaerophilus TaxID=1215385 RepID=A0ABW2V5C6_9BACL|nr:NAD kinase [Paenibacillus thermoaerophilus]TMV18514.1 NAD kinase [Paenibacillus thermoaerophilus]